MIVFDCTEGPTHAALEALRLYGEGYRPTSNKYRHVAKPGSHPSKNTKRLRRVLGKASADDFSRRMNKEQITLDADVFAELKKLCKKHGD